MSVPHNPNRPSVVPDGKDARPHTVKHPLFTYTTRIPVREEIAKQFPSPFEKEPDFTGSPPLFYAHPTPVEQCLSNHMTKYPHPSVPEIVESTVVSDVTDPETKVRSFKRVIKCTNIAPWVFRRIVGGDYVYLTEESTYNPKTREFELHSENQTYSNLVFAKEATLFKPHPDNPQWTSFVQYGGIRCNPYFGPLKRPLEKLVCERMIRGGLQASDLLDDVLESQNPFN